MKIMKLLAGMAYWYTLLRATVLFGEKGFIMIVGATMLYAIMKLKEEEKSNEEDKEE